MLAGQKLGAYGLTEPNAGSDVVSMQTSAVKKGDSWILNGQKLFITNAGLAQTYVVFAQTDKAAGVPDWWKPINASWTFTYPLASK